VKEPNEKLDELIPVVFPNGYLGKFAHLLGWGIGQFHKDDSVEATWDIYQLLQNSTTVDDGQLVIASRRTFVRASYIYLEALAASETASDDWWKIYRFLIEEIQNLEAIEIDAPQGGCDHQWTSWRSFEVCDLCGADR
jgi:hypothetical protein